MTAVQEAANAAHVAGLCVVPPMEDGSKRPHGQWKVFQTSRPTNDQLDEWYGASAGLGVICGAVSGGLEMFEFEGRAVDEGVSEAFRRTAHAAGLGPLLDRIMSGYVERTPSGGYHLLYRVPTPLGNRKLAERPATPEELEADPGSKVRVLIETRSEGGYTILAPSNGRVHPHGGAWVLEAGGFESIVSITDGERDALFALARSLDMMPPPVARPSAVRDDDTRPGDLYNELPDPEGRMQQLLEGHGWVVAFRGGDTCYLRRPGKTEGWSATIGHHPGLFYVFSTSTEFESERAYDAFGVYTLLEHAGDFRAAAQALGEDRSVRVKVPADRDEGSGRKLPTPIVTDRETRRLRLTSASDIAVRPVKWAWKDRMPVGEIVLLGGREGIGKSILAIWIAAQVTRGHLPGEYEGTARDVVIVTTEDSWSHTIVPRLMAAGADLGRIHRVEAVTSDGIDVPLSMPYDLEEFEAILTRVEAALVIFDPLLSRLDARLDTHKDAEVRLALEPLRGVTERSGATLLGLIHVNKSKSDDPLSMLMASRAFAAVARAVLFMTTDPDDRDRRMLGQAKNNLGRMDLPTLAMHIEGVKVADVEEGAVWTGAAVFDGESDMTIHDAVSAALDGTEVRTAVGEAADWLGDYLLPEPAWYADIKRAGIAAGHSESAIKRAATRLAIIKKSKGFPRRSEWQLPSQVIASASNSGESELIELTGLTGSESSGSSQFGPPARDPTGELPWMLPPRIDEALAESANDDTEPAS